MGQKRYWSRCRDCGDRELLRNKTLAKRTVQRCGKCGGIMDPSEDRKGEISHGRMKQASKTGKHYHTAHEG